MCRHCRVATILLLLWPHLCHCRKWWFLLRVEPSIQDPGHSNEDRKAEADLKPEGFYHSPTFDSNYTHNDICSWAARCYRWRNAKGGILQYMIRLLVRRRKLFWEELAFDLRSKRALWASSAVTVFVWRHVGYSSWQAHYNLPPNHPGAWTSPCDATSRP